MKIYKTLNQFIDEQITKFEITDTEENQKKLRAKFMRELKNLNLWDSAETKIIGKAKTKIFSQTELSLLYNQVEEYLIKKSKIDLNDLNTFIEETHHKMQHMLNEVFNEEVNEEVHLKTHKELYNYSAPKVTSHMLNSLMLQAIYEKFFEPVNIKMWNEDLEKQHFTDISDTDTVDYYLLQKRLNNPLKAYVKEKLN